MAPLWFRRLPPLFTVLVAIFVCVSLVGHVVHDTGTSGTTSSCPVGEGGTAADLDSPGVDHLDGLEVSLSQSPQLLPRLAPARRGWNLAADRFPSPFLEVPPPIPISI